MQPPLRSYTVCCYARTVPGMILSLATSRTFTAKGNVDAREQATTEIEMLRSRIYARVWLRDNTNLNYIFDEGQKH